VARHSVGPDDVVLMVRQASVTTPSRTPVPTGS
jgi:hypothetical protein